MSKGPLRTIIGSPTPPRPNVASSVAPAPEVEVEDNVEFLADAIELDEEPDPHDHAVVEPAAAVPVEPEEDDDDDHPSSRGGLLSWILFGVVATLFVGFILLAYLPVEEKNERLEVQVGEQSEGLEQAQAHADELQASHDDLAERLEQAQQEVGTLGEQLSQVTGEKDALQQRVAKQKEKLERLERTQAEFAASLGDDVARGDVSISRRGERLVVDVKDGVLFPQGDIELNKHGRAVLKNVAKTIVANPDRVFQVGGHSDNVPVSDRLAERFPTNWELSALRATQVVRFLQEECGVPGEQLVAAGFSEYRPVTTKSNAKGKRRNRRIEIVMLETEGS